VRGSRRGRGSVIRGARRLRHGSEVHSIARMGVVRVSEVFASIQGEGASVGTPSVFVRFQGCSVGCAWCDTRYSWDAGGGRPVELDALVAEVASAGPRNVVVTGGEPLEHREFVPLVAALKGRGHRVEVETAGTELPPPVDVDQWNVSLKLAHSGVPEPRRLRAEAIARFRDLRAWFKFVVGDERDVDEVLAIQARHGLSSGQILLMPLGMRRDEQQALMPVVVEWCRRHGFRFSPRLHILIWGPKRGV
jgi:7-carboxy-7-deazaguanine synthase